MTMNKIQDIDNHIIADVAARIERLIADARIVDRPCDADEARVMHGAIKKVTGDLEQFGFNTAISALMIYVNEFSARAEMPREAAEQFVKLLSVFAPHLGEELWQMLGHTDTIAYEPWPRWDENALKVSEVEILVQILGKPRARLMMPVGADRAQMEQLALADAGVQAALDGRTVRKVICVPGRLVNIVVG